MVRVGEDPASAIYVRGKRKDCEEVGIRSDEHHLPATTSQADLMALIARLNFALAFGNLPKRPEFLAYCAAHAGRPAKRRAAALDDAAVTA